MGKQLNIAGQIVPDEWLRVVVRGDCMRPVLASGDRVQVVKKRFYLPGDILVFHGGAQPMVAHRFLGYVLTLRGWRVMTKADHGDRPDSLAQLQKIIGKITRVAPYTHPLAISPRNRFRAVRDWLGFTSELFMRTLFSGCQ